MTAPHLSAAQVRNRLTLSARMILRDHDLRADGRCRICRIADCQARTDAEAYLAEVQTR